MLGEDRSAAHAQKGPAPASRWWRKKGEKSPQSYVRKGRVLRGGRGPPQGPGFSEGAGRDSYSPLVSSGAGVGSLSAHTRLAKPAASAAAVIPSILNLTSSHTRDEVIAGSARHVRGSGIGCRATAGGPGAGLRKRGRGGSRAGVPRWAGAAGRGTARRVGGGVGVRGLWTRSGGKVARLPPASWTGCREPGGLPGSPSRRPAVPGLLRACQTRTQTAPS